MDAKDEIIFLGPTNGIFILSSSTSVFAFLRRLELRRADGDLSLSLSLEEGRELERVRRLDLRRFDGEVSFSLSFEEDRELERDFIVVLVTVRVDIKALNLGVHLKRKRGVWRGGRKVAQLAKGSL